MIINDDLRLFIKSISILALVVVLLIVSSCASVRTSAAEYCDPAVWGRWCDPGLTQLTYDWQVLPHDYKTQDAIADAVMGAYE